MSGKQVALLRGINVGKAKRISMADLKALVEELGFKDVQTLLNSGNVIYSAGRTAPASAAKKIAGAITSTLGIESRVQVIAEPAMAEVIAANPLLKVADNDSRHFIVFLDTDADRTRIASLANQEWGAERIVLGTNVAYIWCPVGPIESPLYKALDKIVRDAATARNWATVQKIHALMKS